jgi:hypothetical protein
MSDGYFDATIICKEFGKAFAQYVRLDKTRAYLAALANDLSIDVNNLIEITCGGSRRGSWIHERVVIDLARWLSPSFAVWMDGWVIQQMKTRAIVPAAPSS